ncbi:MAG: CvpA family protein [Desulfobacteraceae bacterium]|nr:CvpA family protein [Desulfobacteraceae bacterium]
MNILDWILVGVGAFWVLRGLMRGAISQVFGIAGILVGFFVACHYYEQVGVLLTRNFPGLTGTGPISFILLFILTWFCIAVAGFSFARIIRGAGLGFLDRLWGGMIGFGKALLFAIATVSVLTLFAVGGTPLLTRSALVPYIKEASNFLFKIAPDKVQSEFYKKQKDLEHFLAEKTAM